MSSTRTLASVIVGYDRATQRSESEEKLMSAFRQWAACAALVVLGAHAAPSFAQASCDRACLRSTLDGYLEAVIKKDPSKAPLAIGVRQTVNAINFATGNNVWQTVTGLGDLQRKYVDTVTGQAGFYGTLKEGDATAIVTIRLRVENRKITEAEWYVARENDPGMGGPRREGGPPANNFNPEYLTANPPPQRVVPANQRVDRATLIRITDSYFDAITSHDHTVGLVHDGCARAENGSPTPAGAFLPPLARGNRAGGPPPGAAPAPARAAGAGTPGAQPGPGRGGCLSGIENFNAALVAARRIPLVDEEAQIVLALGVFIRKPGSPTPRLVSSWWFVIDDAKMKIAYTSMFYPPADLAVPNWPPDSDGNWPLPASLAPPPAPAR
jgi:hypothetical protein